MLTTTHGHLVLRAPARVRSEARAVAKVAAPTTGHSRWEIAALIGTLSLVLPFGLMLFLGL
jgi:hypothetical protein